MKTEAVESTRGVELQRHTALDQPLADRPGRVTTAEAWALAALAIPAATILGGEAIDALGVRLLPALMLPFVLLCSASVAWYARRHAVASSRDTRLFLAIVASVAGWLLWLARPTLLPLSTGPDLTHHLLLVDYIERHWRLVHDPSLARQIGEMAQYTPGAHILAALAGAWSGSDGLHALHAVQCLTVALETGFLYLVAVRMLPERSPRVLAVLSAVLLLASPRYMLGAFTEYGFFSQVVAEVFVAGVWWVSVAWDADPDWRLCLVAGLAGAAVFLTWPVYSGPPMLALFLVVVLRTETAWTRRLRDLLVAFAPFTAVVATYLLGRLGWLRLAGTGGTAPSPSVASFSLPLVVLAVFGVALVCARRSTRATAALVAALVAQTIALYVVAERSGAPQPYMALKMFYLWLRPMTLCAAVAVAFLWQRGWNATRAVRRQRVSETTEMRAAWLLLVTVLLLVARPLWKTPRVLHPKPPAVSQALFEAGRWARANVPPGCVEYLVGDDETAYWLHLAVLGNPRMSDRTGDNSTYEPSDAIVRWLTPNGLPYAIADLGSLPHDVRTELDVVRQFDTAAVARRRGPSTCATP